MESSRFAAVADLDELRSAVAALGSGWLVTVGPDRSPAANLLPIQWRDDRVLVRLPGDNPQWRVLNAADSAVVICPSTPYTVSLSGPARVLRAPSSAPDGPQPASVLVEVSVHEIRAELCPAAPSQRPDRASRALSEPKQTEARREEPTPSEVILLFSQVAVYLSVAIWGLSLTAPTWQRIAIGGVAAAAMALSWGLLASSKAPYPLRGLARALFEAAWFGVGIAALLGAGQPWMASMCAAVILANGLFRVLSRPPTRQPPAS